MSKKNRAELVKEWEGLLALCREKRVAGMDELTDPLASAMLRMRTMEVLRKAMEQAARDATQSLHGLRQSGEESARRLKSYLKARFGEVPEI
jgi:hypothetical protein